MSNSGFAICVTGCLAALEHFHVPPFVAGTLALILGFYLGRIITHGVRNERRGN